jgi:DNA-binding FadR family transcriptional regulator
MTRRTGLIDATVAQLRARITSGDWPVGTRIPPEPALVELLGVGRNTVREAVQSLVHAGLVERRQGSGTYVLSTSELAVSMGRQIADARQRDVIEVRRSLEVEAARLAARRRTTADVATITGLRDQRAEAYRSGALDRMVAADLALHRAIARAARNPVLLSLYENLIDAITDNIRFNFAQILQDGDNHDGLVEAIAAGDDVRAVDETSVYLSGLLGED